MASSDAVLVDDVDDRPLGSVPLGDVELVGGELVDVGGVVVGVGSGDDVSVVGCGGVGVVVSCPPVGSGGRGGGGGCGPPDRLVVDVLESPEVVPLVEVVDDVAVLLVIDDRGGGTGRF